MDEMLFVGVSQDGTRQYEAHIEERVETMLHIGRCGYGWAGNADLYTLASVKSAEQYPSASWHRTEPTPVGWVRVCRRCMPEGPRG